MTHRAPEAVERRDHHDIDALGFDLHHELVERRAPLLGARDACVDELSHVGPAPCPAILTEVTKLVVAGLIAGAHATVQGGALHWSSSSSGAPAPGRRMGVVRSREPPAPLKWYYRPVWV